ncbi:hypothetical protein VNI00_005334 [Paramarasmius palmivorus]|uniref:Uncharacterized protein n=1 Tax=Paramarasmius palmivorus TaxID=297713 RepID=A0AAW0DF51_9AGAR
MIPLQRLLELKTLSKTTNIDLTHYYKSAFGLSKIYDIFFPKASEQALFRQELAEGGSLVSTLALVQLLARQPVRPAELFVYTPAHRVLKMGKIFLDSKYNFQPLPEKRTSTWVISAQPPTFEDAVYTEHSKWYPNTGDLDEYCDDSTMSGVFRFKKDGNRVCIVGTRTEPTEIILTFHSTLFMNVATAEQIISLYPKTSFVDKQALILKELSPATQAILQTFENAGWTTLAVISGEQALHPDDELSLQTRWVGDSHTWIVAGSGSPKLAGDSYQPLEAISWHISCADLDHASVTFQQLEHSTLSRSYPVTWEAERAAWSHPCFFRTQPIQMLGNITVTVEDDTDDSSDTSDSSVSTTSSLIEGIDAEMKQHEYTVTNNVCEHRTVNSSEDMEPALMEFLKKYYLLAYQTYKTNRNLKKIRADLLNLKSTYGQISNHIQYPTGYAMCLIMQHIENVRRSEQCDAVKFQLGFTLTTATNTIVTTCTIIVPEDKVDVVEEELNGSIDWTDDQLLDAGVIVRVEGNA